VFDGILRLAQDLFALPRPGFSMPLPPASGTTMWRHAIYTALIDSNFRYQDHSERTHHGQFDTADEAVAACHATVDAFLTDAFKPGMTATALCEVYVSFGDDRSKTSPAANFRAWDYARWKCDEIADDAAVARL
jgi:hypothetical protein